MIKKIKVSSSKKLETSSKLKISSVKKACRNSKILMVSMYSIDKKCFLFINNNFSRILGRHCKQLKTGGWQFLYSIIHPKDSDTITSSISYFLDNGFKNHFWSGKYHVTQNDTNVYLKHEILVYNIEGQFVAVNFILDISEIERIENSLKPTGKLNNKMPLRGKVPLVLSSRQKQILLLISDGYTSKEISELLRISHHTVITHRKNLISKFRARNSAHLIKKAWNLRF